MIWDFKQRLYRSHKKLPPSAITDIGDPIVQRKLQSYFDTLDTFPPFGAEGEYYASPIAANGRIYVASSRGTITTIRAGDALEVEARNDLGESVMATPAIADNKLYVRSANYLWAFGRK